MLTITCNGVQMPHETVELRSSDELLWSDGTGRGAADGYLVGSVVAQKRTFNIRWGVLTDAEYAIVRAIPRGFFPVVVADGSTTLWSGTCYRSNITADLVGIHGGTRYWKDAEVQLTER